MTSSSANVRPGLAGQALSKVIGTGVHAFSAWSRLAYQATPPRRGKLSYVDHVTIPCQDIEENHAAHLQLTLAGGPRLDVFEYPEGVPVAPMHPHIALAVRPGHLLRWMDRLTEHGVIVAGPTRPGPLGQASFYFNDPFGNHLELVTVGFVDSVLSVGVPDRSQLDYQWSGTSWDQPSRHNSER
jgi:hypothetical protein